MITFNSNMSHIQLVISYDFVMLTWTRMLVTKWLWSFLNVGDNFFFGIFQVIEFALRTFSSDIDFYVNDSDDGQDERGQKNSRSTDRNSYRMNHTKLTSGLHVPPNCSLNNFITGHACTSYYKSRSVVAASSFFTVSTVTKHFQENTKF